MMLQRLSFGFFFFVSFLTRRSLHRRNRCIRCPYEYVLFRICFVGFPTAAKQRVKKKSFADDLALNEAHVPELHLRQAPVTMTSTLATAPQEAPPNLILSIATNPAKSVSLLKLNQPVFNGDCTAWREFWDIFDGMVNTQNLADTA